MELTSRHKWRNRAIAGVVTVAAGVAIAVPGTAADTPPGARISAINNSDTVQTVNDPASSAQAQIAEAEAQAKAARKAAKVAVQAANKAKRISAQATHYALQTRRSSDIRKAKLAQLAAKKATTRMKGAKQTARRATDRAAELRAGATRSASNQRNFVAAEPSSPGTPATSDANRVSVLDLANRARSAAGCGALSYNAQLERAAQGHAEDMQRYNYMSHVSHDGRTFDQRIRAAGFEGGRIGENVGAGFTTPSAVVDAWMHSPAHRANILDCRFTYLGVGYALNGGYWVQNFGA